MHLMLDLETLGTDYGDLVLCAGLVFWEEKDLYRHLFKFNMQQSKADGFKVNPRTLEWWGKQKINHMQFDEPDVDNRTVCKEISDVIKRMKPQTVWGCGPQFDLILLEAYFKFYGVDLPWSYKQERCFRTMRELFGSCAEDLVFEGTEHDPIDDATYQIKALDKIMSCLVLKKPQKITT